MFTAAYPFTYIATRCRKEAYHTRQHGSRWTPSSEEASRFPPCCWYGAQFSQAFVREIGIVASIRHPNIVRLVGFVEDIQNGIAWMIFPWEANGNIREFLSLRQVTVPERISLVSDRN